MTTDQPADLTLPASPAEAYRKQLGVLYSAAGEVARRRDDDLPGLEESLETLLINSGTTKRKVYGWFGANTWQYGDHQVHELFLNADTCHHHPGISKAEGILVTLLHEMCHAYAEASGISDTSRDGRYHNRRFAEIALAIGLQVERDARIGHRTPRLTAHGRVNYDDLLVQLDDGLVLLREPQTARASRGSNDSAANNTDNSDVASKYVFASCACRTDRGQAATIRVARGSWRPDTIRCAACDTTFSPSL